TLRTCIIQLAHCICCVLLFILLTFLLSHYFFFFNDPATTEIYTLSLHDALPIWRTSLTFPFHFAASPVAAGGLVDASHPNSVIQDRKSTRLNSSHVAISYAVFCLKKKKKGTRSDQTRTATGRGTTPRSTSRPSLW